MNKEVAGLWFLYDVAENMDPSLHSQFVGFSTYQQSPHKPTCKRCVMVEAALSVAETMGTDTEYPEFDDVVEALNLDLSDAEHVYFSNGDLDGVKAQILSLIEKRKATD